MDYALGQLELVFDLGLPLLLPAFMGLMEQCEKPSESELSIHWLPTDWYILPKSATLLQLERFLLGDVQVSRTARDDFSSHRRSEHAIIIAAYANTYEN